MASTERDETQVDLLRMSRAPVPWCDEFIKMVSGMNFTAKNAQVMMDIKTDVMQKLKCFNMPTDNHDQLQQMAMYLFGQMGPNSIVEQSLFVIWGCNTFIGNNVRIGEGISIYDNAVVQIGDGTTIGIDVCICTATHDIDHKVRARDWGTSFAKPISIEKNCWIGSSVTILAGVTIGHGATVLNGSVVAKDIEPEAVVTGVPAKPVENFGENDGPAQSDPSGPCNARAHQSGGILQALTYHRVPEQLPRDL